MEFITQFAAVLGTLGLLWFALTTLRRLQNRNGTGRAVHVRQRIAIASGCQLVVVEWRGEEFLIASGNQVCNLVARHRVTNESPLEETRGAWAR